MGRRDVSAGLFYALLSLGGSAFVGMTALPARSPYAFPLLVTATTCVAIALFGLLILFVFPENRKAAKLTATTPRPWPPDMTLHDLTIYVGAGSHWAKMIAQSSPTKATSIYQIEAQLVEKFASGEVAAWARKRPGGREIQIDHAVWAGAKIHLGLDKAFLPAIAKNLYEIRASRFEVTNAWPPG